MALTEEALKGVPVKFPGTETCTHSLSGKNCYKDFVVSEVKIGDFILHDVKGQLIKELWDNKHNKNFKETAASRNGVVGVTLLKNFNILLDYAHAKAILTDKNQTKIAGYNMENWTHVPFTLSHGISTQALINGKAAVLVWDTGAIPSGIRQ
ncbi:MAG: hypothetical protein HWD59_03165 [Coxiellaceae bacterium]|nr:MAG: hypothetical protein HWD59_03165 [Coxiellaceae bacterium]